MHGKISGCGLTVMLMPTDYDNAKQVLKHLIEQSCNDVALGKLYMIIDAARDPRIFPALVASQALHVCLYSEDKVADEIRAVAPYLVRIQQLDDFINWCLEEGLHQQWMIFFTASGQHLPGLRTHFKRLAIVATEDGDRLLFRYYDPRVLSVYLPTCNQTERDYIYKSIPWFWVPQDGQIYLYQRNGDVDILNDHPSTESLDDDTTVICRPVRPSVVK